MALYTMPELKRRAATTHNSYMVKDQLKRLSNSEGPFDIFLSQRQLDAEVVKVLYDDITSMGYSVYVDWITDQGLDRGKVDSKVAEFLRKRLSDAKCLLYVATVDSINSKWMPWELGFKDGQSNKVAILPIATSSIETDTYNGQEYLGLYPYIAKDVTSATGERKLWVHKSEDTYVMLDSWMSGSLPFKRMHTSFTNAY